MQQTELPSKGNAIFVLPLEVLLLQHSFEKIFRLSFLCDTRFYVDVAFIRHLVLLFKKSLVLLLLKDGTDIDIH
jgi:hypothetical protein